MLYTVGKQRCMKLILLNKCWKHPVNFQDYSKQMGDMLLTEIPTKNGYESVLEISATPSDLDIWRKIRKLYLCTR